jgi:hypothetical protein
MKARRVRWAGHVARIGEKRNAYRLLVGRPEGRRFSAVSSGKCWNLKYSQYRFHGHPFQSINHPTILGYVA